MERAPFGPLSRVIRVLLSARDIPAGVLVLRDITACSLMQYFFVLPWQACRSLVKRHSAILRARLCPAPCLACCNRRAKPHKVIRQKWKRMFARGERNLAPDPVVVDVPSAFAEKRIRRGDSDGKTRLLVHLESETAMGQLNIAISPST